jgi:hypothetical protein
MCSLGLVFSLVSPSIADDGPDGPYQVPVGYEYGERCWSDRAAIVNEFMSVTGGTPIAPYARQQAGAFRVLNSANVKFSACGQTDFGNLVSYIEDALLSDEHNVRLVASTGQNANTWFINPLTTFDKKDKFLSTFPPYPGDPVEGHLQYFNGKKWKSLWSCNAWFTLYDRTLDDSFIAMSQSEIEIPESDTITGNDSDNTLWGGLCGEVPKKPGTYKYKLRMYTPTYDYIKCSSSYGGVYCQRYKNNKKYISIKNKIKIVKKKNGNVKVTYVR